MNATLLTLNFSETEFLLIGLKQQLSKIQNCPLCSRSRLHLWWTPLFLRPNNCTFQVLQLSHSSTPLYPPFLDITTASTIATSIVHSKLDYCNSLYYNLHKSQLSRLQHIQNSLARAVVKAPKFSHTTPSPILKSLHWLKVNKRIEYKILSLTYKILSTAQLAYLHNLISVQPPGRTRSSSLVTIARPPSSSSLHTAQRFVLVCSLSF